jgi:hypothetical protein
MHNILIMSAQFKNNPIEFMMTPEQYDLILMVRSQ